MALIDEFIWEMGVYTALLNMAQRPKILESPNAKGALLEKFLDDYLREQHARPVSLVELSRAMNISRRSLHRAFCDVFDLPPATYLRRWRLSQVRRMLTSTEDPGITVSSAARSWGFSELGRFAGQYRQFFGERPSETLRRAIARY